MAETLRVGITRDFMADDGTVALGDIGLGLLDDAASIKWEFLAERTGELTACQIHGYDALAVLGPRITSATVDGADWLTVIARYGVGYDTIDIDACTRNGVAVTITPDGVRRPMATAILTLILALSGQLLQKDRLTRSGGWDRKVDHMGMGLTGRVLGSIGCGNIGRELFTLARPLAMRHIAHDPYARPDPALGVELVDLETLFRTADFVVINCALTPETRHLVNAALDVFEREPVDPDDPLLTLDNVIVTPHAIGWTDEWIHLTGRSALAGILDVADGREPPNVVNHEVLETQRFQDKLARNAARGAT